MSVSQTQAWAAGHGDDYRDGKIPFTVMYWATDYNDPNVQLEFLPGASVGTRAGAGGHESGNRRIFWQGLWRRPIRTRALPVPEELQDKMYDDGPFLFNPLRRRFISASNTRLEGVAASDPYTLDLTQINIK